MVRRTKQNETEVPKKGEESPAYERRAVYPDLGNPSRPEQAKPAPRSAFAPSEPQPAPPPAPPPAPHPDEARCDAVPRPYPFLSATVKADQYGYAPSRPWFSRDAETTFGLYPGETQAPYLAESEASRVLRLESTARGTIYNPVYPFEAQIEYFYRFSAKKGTQKQVLSALIQRLVEDLARL